MDAATHILLGACVAQIPGQLAGRVDPRENHSLTGKLSLLNLSFWQRAGIGGVAAIFPDIDYLLFFWNPLDFLAYWHRAETHSLILAPLWAALLTLISVRSFNCQQHKITLYWICLLALISHSLSDSLTTYGTQWFAPFSEYKVSWNLLFVVDGYFTATVILCFFWLWRKQQSMLKFFIFVAPFAYLIVVSLFKYLSILEIKASNTLPIISHQVTLLPQPLSPLHWQALQSDENTTYQAYLKLANDPIARLISRLMGKGSYSDSFQLQSEINWRQYAITPTGSSLTEAARTAWQHDLFKAFREFAVYPVFYQHCQKEHHECFWFSDLRYHWPGFLPSFRYGMCKDTDNSWQLYRMKYLSISPVTRSDSLRIRQVTTESEFVVVK